jgi:hypothetical protein
MCKAGGGAGSLHCLLPLLLMQKDAWQGNAAHECKAACKVSSAARQLLVGDTSLLLSAPVLLQLDSNIII